MTCFPPPPGFDGHENRPWDGFNYYERACTAEEADLVEAHEAAMEAEERAEITADAEAQRDSWFAMLREELGRARSPDAHGRFGCNNPATGCAGKSRPQPRPLPERPPLQA
jgi:hypothetical protein